MRSHLLLRYNKRYPGEQQKYQDDLTKARFVQMSVKSQAHPGSYHHRGKSNNEKPNCVPSNSPTDPKPYRAHRERCDANRLKNCALFFFGPAPNAAPYGREDTRETSQTAQNSIQKADTRVGSSSNSLDGIYHWPSKTVAAVKHQQCADGNAYMMRGRQLENDDAYRDAERSAYQEGPKTSPLQCSTELPDRNPLRHQTKTNDQCRCLQRSEYVEPNGRRDQSKCETCYPGDQCGGKGRCKKNDHGERRQVCWQSPSPLIAQIQRDRRKAGLKPSRLGPFV